MTSFTCILGMTLVWETELVIRLFTPNFTRFLLNVGDVLYVDVFVQDLFSLVCISVVTSVYRCPFICTICFCLHDEREYIPRLNTVSHCTLADFPMLRIFDRGAVRLISLSLERPVPFLRYYLPLHLQNDNACTFHGPI